MGVAGIGGFFFRARDPQALAEWYLQHLGVGAGQSADPSTPADVWCWRPKAGPLVFAPFREATDYWPADKSFMLNFRVEDLDGLIARLTAGGVAVETRAEWNTPETGRFARIHDPEGNPVELWEMPAGN